MKSALGRSPRVLCKHQETVTCLLSAPRDCALRGARELGGSDATLLWNVIALGAWWLMFRKRAAY
jgi:hypothetical protein